MRLVAVLALTCGLLAAPAAAHAADTVDLIVRRDRGLSAAERTEIRADAGVRFKRHLRLEETELVTVPADQAEQALRALAADPDVACACATASSPRRRSPAPTPTGA